MEKYENLKNRIYEQYFNSSFSDKRIDLDNLAKDIPDPGFVEFERDFDENQREKIKTYYQQREEVVVEDIEELDDVEEFEEENDNMDGIFELFSEIETDVVKLLQYLNLDFYKKADLLNFIIGMMRDKIRSEQLNEEFIDRITNMIKDLVGHEFEELSTKKKERRKELVTFMVDEFEPVIDKMIVEHEEKKINKKFTFFQEKNFKKYLYNEIINHKLDLAKKKMKMNFEEYTFTKKILRRYIDKKYRSDIKISE